MVPGETLGPAELGFWILGIQDVCVTASWAPDQALQVPSFCVLPASGVTSPPASREHILREPHQALAIQKFKLQEVAPPTQPVLALLHIHNALQLVSPVAQRAARVSRGHAVEVCRASGRRSRFLSLLCQQLAVETRTRYTTSLSLSASF